MLAKCDTCFTFPCKNGATCRPTAERDYECVCAPGYHGKYCEAAIDACYGNPCRNGATCKVLEEGRFRFVLVFCHSKQIQVNKTNIFYFYRRTVVTVQLAMKETAVRQTLMTASITNVPTMRLALIRLNLTDVIA